MFLTNTFPLFKFFSTSFACISAPPRVPISLYPRGKKQEVLRIARDDGGHFFPPASVRLKTPPAACAYFTPHYHPLSSVIICSISLPLSHVLLLRPLLPSFLSVTSEDFYRVSPSIAHQSTTLSHVAETCSSSDARTSISSLILLSLSSFSHHLQPPIRDQCTRQFVQHHHALPYQPIKRNNQ